MHVENVLVAPSGHKDLIHEFNAISAMAEVGHVDDDLAFGEAIAYRLRVLAIAGVKVARLELFDCFDVAPALNAGLNASSAAEFQ